jgi:glyceraldehyde 3-phosphate dehydrogenase
MKNSKINLGINGFGRIGRIASRIALDRKHIRLKAINSRADASSHGYLLKYDTSYRIYDKNIKHDDNALYVEGNRISVYREDDIAKIPWKKDNIDIVIDSTGKFRSSDFLQNHLKNGVKYVILSAPAKDDTKTFVLGVNASEFNPIKDKIISNSSCTTNCLSTVLKVLHTNFKVNSGFMTTIHAVTDSQNILDNSHKKEKRLRRAAFGSFIPASTGSAKDIGKLYPELKGKIICQAIRVPTLTVSLINLVVNCHKPCNIEKINKAFETSSQKDLKDILGYTTEELVSVDYTKSPFSAIFDPYLTRVTDGNLINVSAWYDNEWGYATRLIDMVEYIAKKAKIL